MVSRSARWKTTRNILQPKLMREASSRSFVQRLPLVMKALSSLSVPLTIRLIKWLDGRAIGGWTSWHEEWQASSPVGVAGGGVSAPSTVPSGAPAATSFPAGGTSAALACPVVARTPAPVSLGISIPPTVSVAATISFPIYISPAPGWRTRPSHLLLPLGGVMPNLLATVFSKASRGSNQENVTHCRRFSQCNAWKCRSLLKPIRGCEREENKLSLHMAEFIDK